MGAIAVDWKAMAAVARREPRHYVDFSSVAPSQWKMHDRLENWARWCNGSDGRAAGVAPGFEMVKSDEWTEREYGAETAVPVDRDDAAAIQKGVSDLWHKHRRALQWAYLHPKAPAEQARQLGCSLDGLLHYIRAARQALIDSGI